MGKKKAHGGTAKPGDVQTTVSPKPEQSSQGKELSNDSAAKTSADEVARETEKDRDEVLAARKAKAAAKAEKAALAAAKSQAKKTLNSECEQQQPSPAPEATETDKKREAQIAEMKRKAIEARAAKAAKAAEASKEKEECRHMETLIGELSGFGVSLPQEMLRDMLAKKSGHKDRSLEREIEKPQGKSVLRNSTGGLASTISEENLLIAVKHANENMRIEDANSGQILSPALRTVFDKGERGELDCIDELCQQFLQAVKQVISAASRRNREDPSIGEAQHIDKALKEQVSIITCQGRFPLPHALANLMKQVRREVLTIGVANEKTGVIPVISAASRRNREDPSIGEAQHIDKALKEQVSIITCQGRFPLPHALANLMKQVRREVLTIGVANEKTGVIPTMDDVYHWIDDVCIQDNFVLAEKAISNHIAVKMKAVSKIITFDWCPVVNRVLLDSLKDGNSKEICILDAVKDGPGVNHLYSLEDYAGYVEYGDLTAAGNVFTRSSMLLLGCSAVLSSGRILVPRGAMQLALVAVHFNVPVLVLAPTYKFVDKAQSTCRQAIVGRLPSDVLPPDIVTALVTEIRLLPPSSAPAVLKAKALDDAS